MIRRLLFPLLLLTGFTACSQNSLDPFASPDGGGGVDSSEPVKATLTAEQSAVVPGQKFSVAVKLVHSGHWHTFWSNPGQFAQTPSLTCLKGICFWGPAPEKGAWVMERWGG
ncbi:MAG: hypothetical protein ACKV19_27045 [Verrucomicrobiales bacterium]